MTSNELRIGNYIEWVGRHADSRILNLKDFNIVCESLNNNETYFEPVPITEEQLLRFGFKDCGYTFELKRKTKSFIFTWYSKEVLTGKRSGWYCKKYEHIKYVHQLQNLYFALTGGELLLKK